ncbi:MAG: SurA N-terminal domain-containing protein [Hyphomicrobiaceae bacterium]|nr:SurA N-terminal domain-containing protein [Hyphomicrobiaceae bacterium]
MRIALRDCPRRARAPVQASPAVALLPALGAAVLASLALVAATQPSLANQPQPAAATTRVAAGQTPAAAKPAPAKGSPAKPAAADRSQGIAILVNDEPITNFEIEMRQRLLGMSSSGLQDKAKANFQSLIKAESTSERLKGILRKTIEENKGKTREQVLAIFEKRKQEFGASLREQAVASARASVLPGLRKQAIEELIEERLKLQEAKRLNVLVGDDEVKRVIEGIAERNKMNEAQFAQHMKSMGGDLSTMRSRFRANLSWTNVVRRRFGHQIAITDRDLDRAIATIEGADSTELNVQRITLMVSDQLAQAEVARRLTEANALRGQFTGCASTAALAKSVGAARFENLGPTPAGRIGEPVRTMLLSAQDGEMLPASVGQTGVELWVLCGRKAVAAQDSKRDEAAKELRQKEFEVLAKRHLKDLRQDAHIEYR